MKRLRYPLLLLLVAQTALAQNQWTWMHGRQSPDATGIYGTQGTYGSANTPGSRVGAATWRDSDGNLWLFGGTGNGEDNRTGYLNDLWKYDPSRNQWAWIRGSKDINESGEYGDRGEASDDNIPGARQNAVTWVDRQGNLWLFGGYGIASRRNRDGLLNDLWRYSPSSGRWTWISGSDRTDRTGRYSNDRGNNGGGNGRGNDDDDDEDDDDDDNNGNENNELYPGGRFMASGWVDPAGNLWLFGGRGYSSRDDLTDLNDVWRYNPGSDSWTWLSGESDGRARPRHGDRKVFTSQHNPGGRYGATAFTDKDGNFWLYGGRSGNDVYSDLWKYSRTQNQWAWFSGSDNDNATPRFDDQGVPQQNANPGSRLLSAGFSDAQGNLWLFGGSGYGGLLGATPLNNLWRYEIASDKWTFYNGEASQLPQASYGERGAPAPNNQPGGMSNSGSWTDEQGNLWVFGGQSLQGPINQLWKFSIACPAALIGTISPEKATICKDGSQLLTATGGSSYQWSFNGETIAGATGSTLEATKEGTYTVLVTKGQCSAPASNSAVITLVTAPTGSISPKSASICEGSTQTLTVTGGTSYEWRRNGVTLTGETRGTLNVKEPGTYSVIITNGSCSGPASNEVVVERVPQPKGAISPTAVTLCEGGSQVLTATGGTSYVWLRNGQKIADETAETLTVNQPGTYSVIINNGNCSVDGDNEVEVTIGNQSGSRYADVSATPNVPAQLTARPGGTSYQWSPGTGLSDPTSPNPTVTISSQQEYLVTITLSEGCVAVDTVLVKTGAIRKKIVPTAFTPDGNGVNDVLRPLGTFASIDYFRVYNRWGNLVFETNKPGEGWDGRVNGSAQPSDTYMWLFAGTGTDGQPIKETGKTLLIR